jgi:hypothetical protein
MGSGLFFDMMYSSPPAFGLVSVAFFFSFHLAAELTDLTSLVASSAPAITAVGRQLRSRLD